MVSALDSGASGPGLSPGRDIVLCSWARHVTLTVPLSTQAYKWVPANLMLGVTLRWTSIPSRGELKYSHSLHAAETGISSGLMGHLAQMQTLLSENSGELNLLNSHQLIIRDLKHRQRNTRRRRSQPEEDWVEGFVLGWKKES